MNTNGKLNAANAEFRASTCNATSLAANERKNTAQPALKSQAILVPVEDLSGMAKQAMHYAIPFAKKMNARIVFLHILPVTSAPAWRYDGINHKWFFDAHLQLNTEQQLAAFAKESFPTDVPVKAEVRYGTPASNILNVATELDVDLIIMCTHGHSGWIHMLIGSVASNIVRRAPCPVLVVREHENEFVFDEPGVFKAT
jgi:universal stress protein A